jgi:ATP-dependent DNA helicase RecG
MIDKMGYGIHDMAQSQAKRFFPLSDYDQSDGKVRLTIYGGVVDMAYSRLLIQKTDLPLQDIFALDRIQKKLPVPDEVIGHLRRASLIEGRKPNVHVSAMVAAVTDNKAEYILTRSLDDKHYKELILEYLTKFENATRKEINGFIFSKLADVLNEKQKYEKVSNLLSNMRRAGLICNAGSDTKPVWRIAE